MKGIVIEFLKTIDIGQAQDLFAQFAADSEREPVIVTRKGRPIAVVQAVHGADVETISVSLNPQFHTLMERSRRQHDRQEGISSEEMRRHFGLKATQTKKAKNAKSKSKINSRAKKNDRHV